VKNVVVALRAAALVLVALAAWGCGARGQVDTDLAVAREFGAFPLYWLGERFEGWRLEYVESGPDAVVLVYGTCETSGDGGCAPPLQLQVFPLCYHLDAVAANRIWARRTVRGAPVGAFDGAPVMFTSRTQIKVYWGQGADSGAALRALGALRSLNDVPPGVDVDDPIPPPRNGVLEGTAPCSQ
jgi:hypothetical protein